MQIILTNFSYYIDFAETLTINASLSYDPDFPFAKAVFFWTCPNEIEYREC